MDGERGLWAAAQFCVVGAVAQLGERLVRNEEVSGSIPLSSTKSFPQSEARISSSRYGKA